MWQITNSNLTRPRQITPDAPYGAQALPEVGTESMTARPHVNSPVCLPLLSESKKLIWVDSHQIDLQLDGAAELNKAFDRFPYLSDKQTAALAQRCSLHPDQVKVWFMTQRLRYGISWDYNDIREVWNKFKFIQGGAELTKEQHTERKEGFNEDRGNKKQHKEKIKECGGTKTGQELSVKEKETVEQNETTMKQLERNTNQKQPMKQEKNKQVEKDKTNTTKQRKRAAVLGKRKGHDNEDIIERAAQVEEESEKVEHREQKCSKMQKAVEAPHTKKRKRTKKRRNIIPESSVQSSPFVIDVPIDIDSLFILKPQSQIFCTFPQNDNQIDLLDRPDRPHDTQDVPMIPINSNFEWKGELDTGLGKDPQTSLVVTDMDNLNGLTGVDKSLAVSDETPTLTQIPNDHDALWSSCKSKTQAQLNILKMAFLKCQYPSREYYTHLEEQTGISRTVLVQWFRDMRYYIKKSKPRWMSVEQRKQALSTVIHYQCMKMLRKGHQSTKGDCTTEVMIFEQDGRHEEGENGKK